MKNIAINNRSFKLYIKTECWTTPRAKTNIDFILIDEQTDQICATARIRMFENEIPILCALFVQEDFRDMGLGRYMQLIREHHCLHQLNSKFARLYARKDSWMRKWYERRDYKPQATKHENPDLIWMLKHLT